MKLPTHIRVGAVTAVVKKTDEFLHKGKIRKSDCYYGQTLPWSDEIRIHKNCGVHQARSTLFHEIMHLCFHQTNHGLDFDSEEEVIRAISPMLLDALQRNPSLRKYLFED